MKKFTLVLALIFGSNLIAQTDSVEIDIEQYTSGKNNISVLWLGSNLGINGYVDDSYSLALGTAGADWRLDQGRSWYFGLDIVESNFGLGTPIVNITTGLGFDFMWYTFNRDVSLYRDGEDTYVQQDTLAFKKNNLQVSYLNVPLMLSFQTSRDMRKAMTIGFGVIGRLRIGSMTKQTYLNGTTKATLKKKDNFNINPFAASATARIGYGGIELFANYGLTSLFKSSAMNNLYQFEFGISFRGFGDTDFGTKKSKIKIDA